MKKLILCLILIIPIISIAQETENKTNRLSFGLNFSPNYSYRTLSYDDDNQSISSIIDLRTEDEYPSFGFNTGLAVQYLLSNKLELELGFQFSRQAHIIKNIAYKDAIDEPVGVADFNYRYHYLEMPIRLNYLLTYNKFFSYLSGGFSVNQFLNDKSKLEISYYDWSSETKDVNSGIVDFTKTGLSVLAGVGVGYHVNEKLNVRAEPLFRYSLTPLADTPIKQYNYSIGCQIGLFMKL